MRKINNSINWLEVRSLQRVQDKISRQNKKVGWHFQRKPTRQDAAVKISLIHSEVSEALEAVRYRGVKPDSHLPHLSAVAVEMADAVIRIFDFCAIFGFDLGEAIAQKHEYNKTRKDHKRGNRASKGGKIF